MGMMPVYVDYKLPGLCARCGEKVGTEPFRIETAERYRMGNFEHLEIVEFEILLCVSCRQEMTRRKWLNTALGVIGIAFSLVTMPLVLMLIYELNWWLTSIPVILSLVIGMYGFGKRAAYSSGRILGGYDGGKFYFHNPAYRRAFAELNPGMVRLPQRASEWGLPRKLSLPGFEFVA